MNKISYILLIILIVSCKEVEKIKQFPTTYKSNTAITTSDKLEFIVNRFTHLPKNVKIIGIGESTHNSGTIDSLKFGLIKYFIESEKAQIIALEANRFETSELSRLLLNEVSKDEIFEQIRKMPFNHFNYYSTQEAVDFFYWLGQYNSKRDEKITLYGVDNQFSGGALNKLSNHYKDDVVLSQLLKELIEFHPGDNYSRHKDLGGDAYANKSMEINEKLETESNEIRELGHLVYYESLMKESQWQNRDSLMSETLLKIIKKNPDRSVVFLAHNAHIANDNNFANQNIPMAGSFLKKQLDSSYLSISINFQKGFYTAQDLELIEKPYDSIGFFTSLSFDDSFVKDTLFAMDATENSLERQLLPIGNNIAIVDVKKFTENSGILEKTTQRNIGLIKSNDQFFIETDYSNFYDFIITIDKSEAGKYLKRTD